MVRIRGIFTLAACAALAAVLAATGCKKGGDKAGGGKVTGAAATAVDVLPKETSFVVGLSWPKLRENKHIKQALDEQKQTTDQYKNGCGVDLVADPRTVIVAGGGEPVDPKKITIVVTGDWTEDEVNKCITEVFPKQPDGKKVTVAKEGKLTVYTAEGEGPRYVAWTDKGTVLFTLGAMEGDKTHLEELLARKTTVKDNKPFMDLVTKTDSSQTFWAAYLPAADAAKEMGARMSDDGKAQFVGVWLTMAFANALDLDAGIRFAGDPDAKNVADKLTKELETARAQNPQMGEYLKDVKVKPEGKDVLVELNLTEKQVDDLIAMMKQFLPMLPMMLGNMGGGGM